MTSEYAIVMHVGRAHDAPHKPDFAPTARLTGALKLAMVRLTLSRETSS